MTAAPRPHSRRTLAWGVAGFLCLQLGLVAVMEHWRPEFRDPEYGSKLSGLRQRQAEQPGRPLILVLGSSRAAVGFRPGVLSGESDSAKEPLVFNFSLLSSGPVLELLCLQRLLADGIRPDFVLVECWPLMWENRGGKFIEGRGLDAARLGLLDLPRLWPHAADRERLVRDWCSVHLTPWLAHRVNLLRRLMPAWAAREVPPPQPWELTDRQGWFGWHCPDDAAFRRQLTDGARQTFVGYLQDFHHDPRADRALRQLLALCRRRHIPAALLFMPESAEFRGWYPPEVREYAGGYLEHLSGVYDVPLIDARDWVPDDDFIDGYHLRPHGASIFSLRLGREVLPGLLARMRRCQE
jgi:hypothetical protein